MHLIRSLIAGLGVLGCLFLVGVGWPEATPTQQVMLELASVPLQVSVAMAVWHIAARTRWTPRLRQRMVSLASVWVGGAVVVGAGFVRGPRELVPLGQAVCWVALGLALAAVVMALPREKSRTATFIRTPDAPDEDEPDALWSDTEDPSAPDGPRKDSWL